MNPHLFGHLIELVAFAIVGGVSYWLGQRTGYAAGYAEAEAYERTRAFEIAALKYESREGS